MTRPEKDAESAASIADKNERALSGFTLKSGVYDLMSSPLLDYEAIADLHWIAAGVDNSWLEVNATKGLVQAKAFASYENDSGKWTTQEISPNDFVCINPYSDIHTTSRDADLGFYQYSIHLALKAAKAACEREDFVMASRVLDMLAVHIPWLDQLRAMSVGLQGGDTWEGTEELAKMMHFTRGWDICPDYILDTHGSIQPWIRANLFMQLLADSGDILNEKFFAFKNASGAADAYCWSCPNDGHPFGEAYGKIILFDSAMCPILVLSTRFQMTAYASVPDSPWVWELSEEEQETLYTLEQWQRAVVGYPGQASDLCRAIAQSTPEQLAGQELQAALQLWVEKSSSATQWEDTGVSPEIIFWSSHAANAWGQFNPEAYAILQSFTQPWDFYNNLEQVDHWRGLAQRMTPANGLGVEQLALPDFLSEERP